MRVTPIIKLIVTAYTSPQLHGTGSILPLLRLGPSPPPQLRSTDTELRRHYDEQLVEAVYAQGPLHLLPDVR